MNNKLTGIWWTLGILTLVIGIGVLVSHISPTSSSPLVTSTAQEAGALPGMQNTPAPWIAEIEHLRDRLTAIGLPALSAEGTALHIHQHVDIFIHGKAISIPADIGVNEVQRFISPIHTHDTTGVIHVESPTIQTFTLGQFFDIWGVVFSDKCIGSYCTNSNTSETLRAYVDGKVYTGDPRQLALQAHQEIVLVYGTEKEIPQTILSSYTFPKSE